ncbi:MAG: agmatine deiminase family protein [Phycisphaerae bacterium]|nr:agmatine deiminase family protein [Phycisphaerae bacterium]
MRKNNYTQAVPTPNKFLIRFPLFWLMFALTTFGTASDILALHPPVNNPRDHYRPSRELGHGPRNNPGPRHHGRRNPTELFYLDDDSFQPDFAITIDLDVDMETLTVKVSNHLSARENLLGPGVFTFTNNNLLASQIVMPADFQQHKALLLAGGKLAQEYPQLLASIIEKTNNNINLIVLVSNSSEQKRVTNILRTHKLPTNNISFVSIKTNTVWIRDYGPIFVNTINNIVAVDSFYGKLGRQKDDVVPIAVASRLNVSTCQTANTFYGGNILSNGQGLLLTTTDTFNDNIKKGVHSKNTATDFAKFFGADKVVVLEKLKGEQTGHVDMFACFTSADTIIVGQYDENEDSVNAKILDRNADRLEQITVGNKKLKVVRIPMPDNSDGLWRTYTNAVFANGTLLVPVYPHRGPDKQKQAIAVFEKCLPEWNVIAVDVNSIIPAGGALRCISCYLPDDIDMIAYQNNSSQKPVHLVQNISRK